MPRRASPLTAIQVRNAKPGIHVDGGGLMLVVRTADAASWMFRFTYAGKRHDMGLGPARGAAAVSLANARHAAAEARMLVRAGVNPIAKRDADAEARIAAAQAEKAASTLPTFAQAVDRFLQAQAAGWRNPKHRAQWDMTLREYAAPHLGELPVDEVETRHVEAALRPIWHTKPETATRLRGRIEQVLGFAAVQGWRSGENPARWRGHLDKLFPRRSAVRAVVHHAALAWAEAPAFMKALRGERGTAARALEFAILTAARSGEVLGMRWREIDADAAVWTVPAARMKAKREHRVPLTTPALALIHGMSPWRAADGADAFVFPGARARRPLSGMAIEMLVRRMNPDPKEGPPRWRDPSTGKAVTPHGFRSSFRDWAGETTGHPREVIEHALAHRIADKAEAAYARGDLFAKRRLLMDDWAAFLAKAPADPAPDATTG
jgi:integrase